MPFLEMAIPRQPLTSLEWEFWGMSWRKFFSNDRNVFESDGGSARNDDISQGDLFFSEAWNGTLANGSSAPDGSYKLALRTLKLLAADITNPDSWDTYLSPSFTIQRP
jgi:hypothetical protein